MVADDTLTFRVLLEPRQSEPNIWVAECLETGFIATGVGYDEAREGILETLRREAVYARENGRSLARRPTPVDLEERWETVTRGHPPTTIELFPEERKRPGRVTAVEHVAVARSVG